MVHRLPFVSLYECDKLISGWVVERAKHALIKCFPNFQYFSKILHGPSLFTLRRRPPLILCEVLSDEYKWGGVDKFSPVTTYG